MEFVLKVYLAGRYSSRLTLLEYAKELAAEGIITTSRWLSGIYDNIAAAPTIKMSGEWAAEDLADIDRAHILVLFSDLGAENTGGSPSTGGKSIEMGYAVAKHKTIMVVGPVENIFQYLPGVILKTDWPAALDHLICLSENLEEGDTNGIEPSQPR